MDKQLYIKGDEKFVNEVIEFVRPRIGKKKIWLVDSLPELKESED